MTVMAWTDKAQRWLEDIFGRIAADDPRTASRIVQEIHEKVQVCNRRWSG